MSNHLFISVVALAIVVTGCGSNPKIESSKNGAIPKEEPVSKYGNPQTYKVLGKNYAVKETSKGHSEVGIASWYGKDFHGKRTSSGTPYNMYNYSAAHRTLPIPTYVKVTNLENGKSINVRVDDRGPFAKDRIIDLSYQAAKDLGMIGKGTAKVKVVALEPYQHKSAPKAAYGHTYITDTHETFTDSRGDTLEVEDNYASLPIPVPNNNNFGNYTIQLNAYSSANNASNYQEQIRQAYNLPTEVHYDGQFYRVIVHRFNTQQEAENATFSLKEQGLSAKTFKI